MISGFMDLLKPDHKRLKLFSLFIFLAILGYIQSLKNPPAYISLVHSLLNFIPSLLGILELLSMPVRHLLTPFQSLLTSLDYDLRMTLGFFILVSYFYVLSCILIFLYEKFSHRRHLRYVFRDFENLIGEIVG